MSGLCLDYTLLFSLQAWPTRAEDFLSHMKDTQMRRERQMMPRPLRKYLFAGFLDFSTHQELIQNKVDLQATFCFNLFWKRLTDFLSSRSDLTYYPNDPAVDDSQKPPNLESLQGSGDIAKIPRCASNQLCFVTRDYQLLLNKRFAVTGEAGQPNAGTD